MISLCFRGLLALICLACVTSFVHSEDNAAQQTIEDDDADSFYRHGRQFYRFGRALSPVWDSDDESLLRKNHLIHWPGYPISPVMDNDVFSRSNREFYRFGRAYPPYQDKRFLRFGRSLQADNEEYPHFVVLHSDNQLYRKRRSPQPNSQSEALTAQSSQSESGKSSLVSKDLQKRATAPEETKTEETQLPYNAIVNGEDDKEKRFMRFGKRFMRFGRRDNEDEDFDKRFMRFGKRFMRFGRGDENDQMEDKRFMRFGKRFMRFGRGDEQDEEEEKRFMRFGKSSESDGDYDKRFMRFGKSFGSDDDYDKRFMRFGKRFMRFGRAYDDDENAPASADKEGEDKRFMRFGKRSKRESAKQQISNNASAAL